MFSKEPLQFADNIEMLYALYKEVPYLITEIITNGKKYIGTVCSVKYDEAGKISSGFFHPNLERNYFEAFEITSDSFICIRIIDIEAQANDPTIRNMFRSLNVIYSLSSKNIDTIRRTLKDFLSIIKKSIVDFSELHAYKDIHHSERVLNRALTYCLFFEEEESPLQDKEIIEEILEEIKEDAAIAVALTLFGSGN